MHLNHINIRIDNCEFKGNLAKVSTNGIDMISTELMITNSVIDNSFNKYNFPLTNIVACGFICMNYESSLTVRDTKISYVNGFKAGFLSSEGHSSVYIQQNTIFSNCYGKDGCIFSHSNHKLQFQGLILSESSSLNIVK